MTDPLKPPIMTPEERKRKIAAENLKKGREVKKRLMEEKKAEEERQKKMELEFPPFEPKQFIYDESEISSIEEEPQQPLLSNGKKARSVPYTPKEKKKPRVMEPGDPILKKQKTNHEPPTPKQSTPSWWDDAKATLLDSQNLASVGFILIAALLRLGLPFAEVAIEKSWETRRTYTDTNHQVPPPKVESPMVDPKPVESKPSNDPPTLSFIG